MKCALFLSYITKNLEGKLPSEFRIVPFYFFNLIYGHKSTLAAPKYIFPNLGKFGNYSSGNKCMGRGWNKVALG